MGGSEITDLASVFSVASKSMKDNLIELGA